MRGHMPAVLLALLAGLTGGTITQAQISSFQHVVFVIQENRTPDNLFQGLCTSSTLCSITPTKTQYNIQTSNWLDKTQPTGVTQPLSAALAAGYDIDHSHPSFTKECDMNTATGLCAMDGAAAITCSGACPTQPSFRYADNSTGILDPYVQIATQFGWANYMFQTNQGPSFPAHQFLFGGTSAPTAADDAAGIFAAENLKSTDGIAGCIATSSTLVKEISPPNTETQFIYPCFEHNTVPDVLPAQFSWKYYTPKAGSIWTAPDAINHICQPDQATGGNCVGPEWTANVDLNPADVLSDIAKCTLASMSWVIPKGANSDHPRNNTGGGPAWVASLVDAIGSSTCKNPDGSSYWNSTAILITWDDWGGWYDHEPPTFLAQPQGDYQYGFRVPFIFVSAYTPAGYIDNDRHDFGSMIRFVEKNFGITQGALNFADARASDSLSNFFNLKSAPRQFSTIPASRSAAFFLNDTTPSADPDTD